MRTLKDSVVVVTGASMGIGRAIAEELGRGGAKVVVNYFHHKEEADEVVEGLLKNGASAAVAIQADVSQADQAARLIEDTIKEFDRIDVLVNNEGINIDRTLKTMSVEDWNTVIQTDLNAYFYTVKAALPYFMQQQSGTILNISSTTAQIGNYGQANYGAAKEGIIGFTKTAALELARYNVTVNVLSLGAIDTPHMWGKVKQEYEDGVMKRIPLGRFGSAEEVALAARFLIVDATYCTGTTIQINGGIYMP
ncbi:MAG TPA: 3-oxoacyl-ACP reductase family protein [Ktedonobacteraceae bacterium]|nr:3-oxoacyl-ACP reductase family protein [Ktedonobacteraceae bacterium]